MRRTAALLPAPRPEPVAFVTDRLPDALLDTSTTDCTALQQTLRTTNDAYFQPDRLSLKH